MSVDSIPAVPDEPTPIRGFDIVHLRGKAEVQAFVDEFGRGALQAQVDSGMYGGLFLENALAWLAAHPA